MLSRCAWLRLTSLIKITLILRQAGYGVKCLVSKLLLFLRAFTLKTKSPFRNSRDDMTTQASTKHTYMHTYTYMYTQTYIYIHNHAIWNAKFNFPSCIPFQFKTSGPLWREMPFLLKRSTGCANCRSRRIKVCCFNSISRYHTLDKDTEADDVSAMNWDPAVHNVRGLV